MDAAPQGTDPVVVEGTCPGCRTTWRFILAPGARLALPLRFRCPICGYGVCECGGGNARGAPTYCAACRGQADRPYVGPALRR